MKRDNLRLFGIGILLGAGIVAVSVWADEKIEMSTYVPAASNQWDRVHANRATIGTPYSITNPAEPAPADGTLLVNGNIGVGVTSPRSPAPGGATTGNLDANDVYLRSVSRWASQITEAPDYDSGWVADNSATDHYTTFNHNFGDFPSRTEIWFATSNNPTVIYPINWPWIYNYSGNPVTISMTTTQVRFSIVASDVGWLHGVWEPNRSLPNAGWTFYGSGYWRVKCWK